MDPQYWIILGTVLFLVLILLYFFSPSYQNKVLVTAAGPFGLETTTPIIVEADAKSYYSDTAGSFSAFVYLNPMNRTGAHVECGTNINTASCTDGTFAPCKCVTVTSDCSVCQHNGYYSVFNIAGIAGLEVLNAPDASRQGKAMSQLIIKTEGPAVTEDTGTGGTGTAGTGNTDYIKNVNDAKAAEEAARTEANPNLASCTAISAEDRATAAKALHDAHVATAHQATLDAQSASATIAAMSQKYIETLTLPPIPLQKWTMITVAREGRRFDVYYNDTIVLSQKTMQMPISNKSNTNLTGITSGSPGLLGELALANVYNYRLSSQDVAVKFNELADTRGRPYINAVSAPVTLSAQVGINPGGVSTMNIGSFMPSINLCPPGGCLNLPAIQPAGYLYDWSY